MSMQDVEMIFKFVGGLGMFLYGMNIMADGLQKSAGPKMKRLMGILTNNRLLAVLVGTLVTAIIQSSSATTVMVVGFVNAGIMNLAQAVGVIMGANVGTTVTAWLVSMSEWGAFLKPEFFAPLLIGVGAFIMLFAKRDGKKRPERFWLVLECCLSGSALCQAQSHHIKMPRFSLKRSEFWEVILSWEFWPV